MGRLWELLFVFFKIGLCSIGGGYAVIPMIQSQVVERYGWITQQMFADIITISQMTPGPLAVNTSTFIGIRIAGIAGAVLATAGCVISGIVISTLLYRFFKRHSKSDYIAGVLNGLKASSLGLIISAAGVILGMTFAGTDVVNGGMKVDWIAVAVFCGILFALRKWKMNPVILLVAAGVVGGMWY